VSDNFDAIVIGAGVIGAATAFELAKSGRRTLSLDRLPAAGYGSTSSSSAVIRSFYSTVAGANLAWESYQVWLDWAGHIGLDANGACIDERGPAQYRETGCLVVKVAENDHMRPVCEVMKKVGIPFEEWDAAEIAKRYPYIDTRSFGPPKTADDPDFGEASGGDIAGAVFFPNAGYVNDPQLAAHNLQCAAEAAGAEFRFNSEVIEIRRAGGRVAGVELADGSRIDAPVVVNVGGPHSGRVNAMADVMADMSVRTRALRKEVCYIPEPTDVAFDRTGLFLLDSDVGGYCRPESGAKIVIGSPEPDCDELQWVDDPDNYNRAFSDQWMTQAMRIGMRLPTLGIPGQATGVVDLYDVSDDWIPIYDKSDLPGFYMACGTSGNQFKNAPVAGALMTALIDACESGHNHDAEAVSFRLPRTGVDLDLGLFSRRRAVNQDSSFSVMG